MNDDMSREHKLGLSDGMNWGLSDGVSWARIGDE